MTSDSSQPSSAPVALSGVHPSNLLEHLLIALGGPPSRIPLLAASPSCPPKHGTTVSAIVAYVDRRTRALQRNLDAAIQAKSAAEQEKNAAQQQKIAAEHERDAAIQERDAAIQERDAAIQERDAAIQERDAAILERDAAIQKQLPLRQEIHTLQQQYDDLEELYDGRDVENKRILDVSAEVDRRRREEIATLNLTIAQLESEREETASSHAQRIAQLEAQNQHAQEQLAIAKLENTNLRQDQERTEKQNGTLREDNSVLSEDNLVLMENIGGLAAGLELAEQRMLTAEQIALSTLSLNCWLMVEQRILANLILVVRGVAGHRIHAADISLAQRTAQAEQYRHERDEAAMEVIELQDRLDDVQKEKKNSLGRLKRKNENLQALLDSVLDRVESGNWARLQPDAVVGEGEQPSTPLDGGHGFASQGTTLRSGASQSSHPRSEKSSGRGAGKQPVVWRKPGARHEVYVEYRPSRED